MEKQLNFETEDEFEIAIRKGVRKFHQSNLSDIKEEDEAHHLADKYMPDNPNSHGVVRPIGSIIKQNIVSLSDEDDEISDEQSFESYELDHQIDQWEKINERKPGMLVNKKVGMINVGIAAAERNGKNNHL